MKAQNFFDFISIDEYSATPKYMQLTNAIVKAVETGKVKKNDLLPSINELSCELEISRDTAEKGYKYLKKLGVIESFPGKGYYISNPGFKQKLKVFLLFNKLSAHKKIVYDAFVKALGDNVAVDFYIYNNDFALFKKLVAGRQDDYSHFVIIPHFVEEEEKAVEIINAIPKEKLLLLDKRIESITGNYAAVYEDFENDIYKALEQALSQLSKYHTLKLLFPARSYHPKDIIRGFVRFCGQYAFTHVLVSDIKRDIIAKGEVYINLMEDDLVVLLERILQAELEIGKDIGVISYNETPLKRFILNGITTISTDFNYMGKAAAELILTGTQEQVEVPFYLELRASL